LRIGGTTAVSSHYFLDGLQGQIYGFAFVRSGRFRSSWGTGMTFTSAKSFLSGSMKSAALPMMIRLGVVSKYFAAKAVTSALVTALIDGMNLFRVSSGKSFVIIAEIFPTNPPLVSRVRA